MIIISELLKLYLKSIFSRLNIISDLLKKVFSEKRKKKEKTSLGNIFDFYSDCEKVLTSTVNHILIGFFEILPYYFWLLLKLSVNSP